MALLQMQRIFIYALKKDRKRILELLQRRGVVEIGNLLKEDNVFHKNDVSNARTGFERNIASAREALDILHTYVPYKKSMLSALSGRKEVSSDVYDTFKEKYEAVVNSANKIISLSKKIAENKAEILKLHTQTEILTPWVNLDLPMDFSGTKHTSGFIGTLPNAWTLEEIYEKLAQYLPVNVDIISSTKDQTCIFVLCLKNKADKVYEALRGIEFSLPSLSFEKAPADQLKNLKNQVSKAQEEIDTAEEEIKSYASEREDLLFLQDYDTMRAEKYEAISSLLQSRNVFIISGFIPERDGQKLARELESEFDLTVELEKPKKKDDVPILYRNNGFSAPLEGTVSAFSPPGKGEADPTTVMSLFYYMLFGLMLSDAGYGFIMTLGCAFALIKFRDTMERPMKNTMKMYLFCGIATVFWGVMFGSYFGDIFDSVASTFFGVTKLPVVPPLWFFPVEKPMLMLTFSMALGIIHLLTGLAMKGYQLAKQKDYKAILYDVVFWYILLISGILLLLSMEMITNILGISVSIPSGIINIAKILALIAAVGIILTNGRESKSPFKRVLKGLYALYGISGYLSDVLSYSRLLALGLATGVIGTVINKMAAMTAGGILGVVAYTIVVLFGHTLNLGINALGAYVHTNRLQYVEFFGKFYEGGGRLFKPFNVNTKYFKFKESTKHGNIE